MKIVVCLKPAVVASEFACEATTGAPIRPERVQISEVDEAALQTALDLKKSHNGSQITVLCIADRAAESLLRHTLHAGADHAIKLDVQHGDNIPFDTSAAAKIAATAIREMKPDLVICGARSPDHGSGFFPYALAAAMDYPVVAGAVSLTLEQNRLTTVRKLAQGWRENYRLDLPAVLAVEADIVQPTHVAVMGRSYREAVGRTVETWPLDKLGMETCPDSLEQEIELSMPRPRRKTATRSKGGSSRNRLKRMKGGSDKSETLEGPPEQLAVEFLKRIRQWQQ